MSTRDQYVASIKKQLDEMNEQLDRLSAKSSDAKKDLKLRYESEMKSLREQSDQAKSRLAELRSASEDSWDSSVAEIEKITAAMKHSFNYFKSQL
jgi:predicted  nucleic acid-binding Zn-ribbon protein